jgi:hypothetical protein
MQGSEAGQEARSTVKLAIRLNAQDNVATAMQALQPGETLSVLSDRGTEVDRVPVTTPLPLPFHKVALAEIQRGTAVLKYGEVIGHATAPIARGEWVHTHNLQSASFPATEEQA